MVNFPHHYNPREGIFRMIRQHIANMSPDIIEMLMALTTMIGLKSSLVVDGEVTAADRAFVENNPELLMEVEKLKELHEITSFPIPVDPILLEKHITTALSSFTKDGEIIPFRRHKFVQRGALLAAAAAAVGAAQRQRSMFR